MWIWGAGSWPLQIEPEGQSKIGAYDLGGQGRGPLQWDIFTVDQINEKDQYKLVYSYEIPSQSELALMAIQGWFGEQGDSYKETWCWSKRSYFCTSSGQCSPICFGWKAEAVKQKAQEEKQEEKEMLQMSGHDKQQHVARDVSFGDEAAFQEVTLEFAARKFLVVKQMQRKAIERQKTPA